MLNDAPPTLLNTIMHNKHLSHLMAKSMNELAHKSPLIYSIISLIMSLCLRANSRAFATTHFFLVKYNLGFLLFLSWRFFKIKMRLFWVCI